MKFLKKLISCIVIVCIFSSIMVLSTFTSNAKIIKYGDYTYEVLYDGTAIVWYHGSDSNVVIPKTINGYKISTIGLGAFWENDTVISITFPDSIKTLGYYAGNSVIYQCKNLERIYIGKNAKAFYGMDSLVYNCEKLTDITIDKKNKYYSSINGNVYNKKQTRFLLYPQGKKESSFKIPKTVEIIDERSFSSAANLKSVVIGSKVTHIKSYAFSGCLKLKTINYSSNIHNWRKIDIKDDGNSKFKKATVVFNDGTTSKNNTQKSKISSCTVKGIKTLTYTGKTLTQKITIKNGAATLKKNKDYTISYKNNKNAGEATILITGKGGYKGTIKKTFTIKKAANPIKVKTVEKTVDSVSLSSMEQIVNGAITINKSVGTVVYTKVEEGSSEYLNIDENGDITVQQGDYENQTLKITVKVTAKGDTNYKSGSETVTAEIIIV